MLDGELAGPGGRPTRISSSWFGAVGQPGRFMFEMGHRSKSP